MVLRRGCPVLLLLLLSAVCTPPAVSAQSALRRGAAVQAVPLAKHGQLLFGLGFAYEPGVTAPLIAVTGDLFRWGIMQLTYAIADGVILELRGDPYRVLSVERFGEPLIEPDDGAENGKITGAGDYFADVSFRLLGGPTGFAMGGRLGVSIPSSDEAEGLGTNTTDVRATLLGSYGRGPLRITGDLGLAILEAPVDFFEQNDVIAYSAELLYRPLQMLPMRVFVGINGRASIRATVPPGTEDTGKVMLGLDYRTGRFLVDLGGGFGYVENSPDWSVATGAALVLGG